MLFPPSFSYFSSLPDHFVEINNEIFLYSLYEVHYVRMPKPQDVPLGRRLIMLYIDEAEFETVGCER